MRFRPRVKWHSLKIKSVLVIYNFICLMGIDCFRFDLLLIPCNILIMRIWSHSCLVKVTVIQLIVVFRLIVFAFNVTEMSMTLVKVICGIKSIRFLRIPVVSLNPKQRLVLFFKIWQRRESLDKLNRFILFFCIVPTVLITYKLLNLYIVVVINNYFAWFFVRVWN